MKYYLLLAGKVGILLLLVFFSIKLLLSFLYIRRKYIGTDILNALKPGKVRGKGKIFLFSLLFLFLTVVIFTGNSRQNAAINIALTYKEASLGLNPNGSRYNMSNIISDEVIEEAIAFGGFQDVSVEEIKDGLELRPADTETDTDEMVSTQFVLSFSNNRKTKDLEADEVVYAVANSYRNWFIQEYAPNYNILDISFEDISEYDYPEVEMYLSNAIKIICSYSDSYIEKDSSFISEKTGESFSALNAKAWDIHNTGLESLSAYILANGLSEDRAGYLSRLRYDYTNQCNNYRSDIQGYDVRIKAIQKYDNDMATVVYIPTYDVDNTFYMSKTKIGIDHFSEDADSLSSSAANTLSILLDEKYLMQQLENGQSSSEAFLKAEEMIGTLKNQILSLADATVKTVRDYTDTTSNGYISIAVPDGTDMITYAFIAVISFVFCLLFYGCSAVEQLKRKNIRKG